MHTKKSALGVRLIKFLSIMPELALQLHFRRMGLEDETSKIIRMNADNCHLGAAMA